MNPELALSFDISGLPALQKVCVGSIDMEVYTHADPIERFESFVTRLSSLPLLIEDDLDFLVPLTGGHGESAALDCLMHLHNPLRGKRVVLFVANSFSHSTVNQIRSRKKSENVNFKACKFPAKAMVHAAKRLRELRWMCLTKCLLMSLLCL